MKLGTVVQNLTVLAKALLIIGFVAVGIGVIQTPTDAPPSVPFDIWLWPVNLMWVSLSFTGFNSAIYVAEECVEPQVDIPRALLLGTGITAILYLSVNAVFLYSAPISELAGVPNIALVSAFALGGAELMRAVQGLVLLSLFTLLSGMAVAGPRVVVKMGEDGYLPSMSLTTAAFVQCAIAVFMTLNSDLVSQLTYLSLTLSLSSALAVACVYRLPVSQRPHPVAPIIYLCGTLLGALASLKVAPFAGLAAFLTIGSGGFVYLLLFGLKTNQGETGPKETREVQEVTRSFSEE